MPSRNVELAGAAYEAMNRGDLDWLIALSDPDIHMHMRGVAGEPVLYVGASGIREYFRDMAEIWESVEFFPEEIRDLGDRVFVILRQRLRGRGSGISVEAKFGSVAHLRDGLVTEIRSYRDIAEALAHAGLDS